ncbi:MAG: hypothetical protein GYB66_11135 [Chloroflexi bacterium]|nr:hypothetical protein [Chloroflexota bacterium]
MSQQGFPPQRDRNSDQDQDIFMGNYDFGQGQQQPPPFGMYPEPQPQRSNLLGRTCLIAGVGAFACICIACVCMAGVLYMSRETVPALVWVQFANQNDLETAKDAGVICEGSQAEAFTTWFQEQYSADVSITTSSTQPSGDDNEVLVEGTLEDNGEVVDYRATFIIDPDGDFLFFFGCIAEIRQEEPEAPTDFSAE